MSLCNHGHNEGQKVSLKSGKGTKKVEPAGFVFFILREWNVKVDPNDIFQVDLDTRNGDFEIAEIDLEDVRAFSNFCQKYENSSFTYFYKLAWSRILLSDFLSSTDSETGDENVVKKKEKKFKSIKTLGLVRNFISKGKNAYQLLNCTDSDEASKIKSNYRKIVLLLHPDKSANQKVPDDLKDYEKRYKVSSISREEKSELFLLIQDAFTILSDPDMRLEYDSNLPFDEYIPTHEDAKRNDFFLLFGPVFKMNSRWSRTKPVPSLGDNDSDDNYVEEFYEFWRNFETLRTFSHAAPHLLEEAESREEKRWMERENLKVQKKLIKKEQLRIQKLIDLSQQYDPRLKRKQDRIRQEKLVKQKQAQEAKLEEMRRVELEKEKERLKAQEEADRIKFEKQIAKKMRQHIRLVSQRDDVFSQASKNFDKLVNFEYSEMKDFSQKMYNILKLEFNFDRNPDAEYLEELKSLDQSLREFETDEFSRQDLCTLFEAISLKLDPNTNTEPEKPNQNTISSATVKELKENEVRSENLWSTADLARLAKGVELYQPGTPGRWNLISKYVKTKSMPQCIEMAKLVSNNSDISSFMAKDTNSDSSNTTVTNSSDANSQGTNLSSGWTQDQQTAFENALKKYPSHIDPMVRWRKIASEVPGKTAKDCISRFKEIRAAITKSK